MTMQFRVSKLVRTRGEIGDSTTANGCDGRCVPATAVAQHGAGDAMSPRLRLPAPRRPFGGAGNGPECTPHCGVGR